jgi:hypothetical protein
MGQADPRIVTGEGLRIFAAVMRADENDQSAYKEMSQSDEFRHPISYSDIQLQEAGLIDYRREHIRLLDTEALKDVACEFYRAINGLFLRLIGRSPDRR